jgi:hypothetical protein
MHNSGVPLHVVGTKFSKSMKFLMTSNGIKYIEINLKHKFTRQFKYPVECYYHFWGPKIFGPRGFTHSVAVDGDLLCNKKLGNVAQLAGNYIGAVGLGPVFAWKCITKDLPIYQKHMLISKIHLRQPRPQSGVLFYNNVNLQKIGFSEEVARLYGVALKLGVPRKGDDSLLSLYVISQEAQRIHYISGSYNVRNPVNPTTLRSAYIFHFVKHKPWSVFSRSSNPNMPRNVYMFLVQRWQRLAKRKLTPVQLRTYFLSLS